MISVIVPVYKVEKYLEKCVKSILAQTYADYELILVDDGSPDNCPLMCDEFAKKDKRIRVIHKENGGLSEARNSGTSIAQGNYVTFIDSDDYVSEDYLKTLLSLLENNKADIAITGICLYTDGSEPILNKKDEFFCYTGVEALEKMLYQDSFDTSACAILLPIDIAKRYPFPVGKYHEDEFTTYKYYSSVDKVVVSTRSQYFYLQRAGSIMHTFGQASLDELDAADNLVNFCEKNFPQLVKAAESKKFSDYCQVLLSVKNLKELHCQSYQRIIDYINSKRYQIIKDKNTRLKNKVAAFLLCLGLHWLKFVKGIKK